MIADISKMVNVRVVVNQRVNVLSFGLTDVQSISAVKNIAHIFVVYVANFPVIGLQTKLPNRTRTESKSLKCSEKNTWR